MTDDIDWQLLHRYLAHECNAVEVREVERSLAADPERRAMLRSLQDLTERARATGGDAPPWNSQAQWQRLKQQMVPGGGERAPVESERSPQPRFMVGRTPGVLPRPVRIAAAVALLVGSGAVWWTLQRQRAAAPPVEVAVREYNSPRGQRADFRLPDGTRVLLGVASRLRVRADHGDIRRDVELEGAAYFEVTHDATKPFAVHMANAVARDLGTRFTARAYPGEMAAQVVVAEGRVALRANNGSHRSAGGADEEALLEVGQLGRVDSTGAVSVRRGIDLGHYLAWTEGRLVFKDTPLRDALPELSRWFDLDFRLGDTALGKRRLTASFYNQPNNEALDMLAVSLGLRHERRGRIVTFTP